MQRDDFRLTDELVPEVEDEDNGDVDIGRDEGFRVPAAELGGVVSRVVLSYPGGRKRGGGVPGWEGLTGHE